MLNDLTSDHRNPTRRLSRLVSIALLCALAALHSARAQTDNFDDGDDLGWTRYSPLASFGAPGTFTFPNGAYRLQYPAFAHPQLGISRGATYRADVSYSDFSVSVDVLDYSDASDTWFGIGARMGSVSLGQSVGYYFHYYPANDELHLDYLVNEGTFNLDAVSGLVLNPSTGYRMVFNGQGSTLSAALFELKNLSTPIATLQATDSRYSSGPAGLVVASTSGGVDVTFDNYVAVVPEPGTVALLGFGLAGLGAVRCRGVRRRDAH